MSVPFVPGTFSGRCPVRNQAMKKNLQKNTYSKLVKDITELYRAKSPQNAPVLPDSQNIAAGGKVELEREQQGETNAIYGEHLLGCV